MAVGELLAILGVKDPKALAESLEQLNAAARPVLVQLAAWQQRVTHAMKRYIEELPPETRAMLEGVARASAQSDRGGDSSATLWWMQPETISVRAESAEASEVSEVEQLRATVDELRAKMEAMEERLGRPLPGTWTGKKTSGDPS